MTSEKTLLWYDYETWGATPARDRLAQFAAIRTDLDLNIIDEPVDILCKPPVDAVIDPESVMITGLSPIELADKGLSEWDFAKQILDEMSQSGTCTVGYNSIRFDDECTRYLFYRNLHDPYAREWRNGNSRWDILDMVRMTKALRPEGIVWPVKEDGSPSFKLEHLTEANGIAHEKAHDAVSDVKATIAMAKLIKDKQPKLYNFAFALRGKREVLKHLDIERHTPHLHFTGKVPATEHCLGIEMPLTTHPDRNNEVIVIDIRRDPSWVINYSADELRSWLYTATADLPEGVERPPFKTIHINRSPMVAPISLLDESTAERLEVDMEAVNQHQQWVDANPEVLRLALDIFCLGEEREPSPDPEQALYSGFIDNHDRGLLNQMAAEKLPKERWLDESHQLHDSRLPPLITSVLARNFPEALTDAQLNNWQQQRLQYLTDPDFGQSLTVDEALNKVQTLKSDHSDFTPLLETEKYLQSFHHNWFVTIASKFETAPSDAGVTEYKPEQQDETPPINDQLDLF